MNKAQFVDLLARNGDLTRAKAEEALATTIHSITDALSAGEEVKLSGLGTFSVVEVPARAGRNPQTGAEIQIPARRAVRFKAAKPLKDAIHV